MAHARQINCLCCTSWNVIMSSHSVLHKLSVPIGKPPIVTFLPAEMSVTQLVLLTRTSNWCALGRSLHVICGKKIIDRVWPRTQCWNKYCLIPFTSHSTISLVYSKQRKSLNAIYRANFLGPHLDWSLFLCMASLSKNWWLDQCLNERAMKVAPPSVGFVDLSVYLFDYLCRCVRACVGWWLKMKVWVKIGWSAPHQPLGRKERGEVA